MKPSKKQLHIRRPFREHVSELRSRLTWSIISLGVGSVAGYQLREMLLKLLLKPLGQPVFYTSPAGGLELVLKVSLLFGVVVSLPILLYHILKFTEPLMPQSRKTSFIGLILSSIFLIFLGVFFAYVVALPTALKFLGGFSDMSGVRSLISTNEYLSFVMTYLLMFAILFQIPIAILVINHIAPLKLATLIGKQRWVILISFIIGAIVSPAPDPVNQTIMALPIIVLYEISLVLVWIINRRRINKAMA